MKVPALHHLVGRRRVAGGPRREAVHEATELAERFRERVAVTRGEARRVPDERSRTMSAEANVAVVQAMYETFGRGDIPVILDHPVDEIDWEAGRDDDYGIPWLRPGRGKDHVLSFFSNRSGTSQSVAKPSLKSRIFP